MKPHWILKNSAIVVLLLLTASMANAGEVSGHVGGFIGLKTMDSSDWPDLDTHFSMGVMFDIKKNSWPISVALDLMDTGDKHEHDGLENLGHTTELDLGVRKIFAKQDSKFQPYVGGGVSFLSAEQEYQESSGTVKQDDRAVGGWLGLGMYYEVVPGFALGFDVRYSYGEVFLFDQERNAGGLSAGITAGYRF